MSQNRVVSPSAQVRTDASKPPSSFRVSPACLLPARRHRVFSLSGRGFSVATRATRAEPTSVYPSIQEQTLS